MNQKFFIFIILILFSSSSISLTNNNLLNNQIFYPKLLWGFEFISSKKVKVINTDLNKITKIDEYYYDVDLELFYINIFSSKDTIRDRLYSIELNSLRAEVWTMTGNDFTTREMFLVGLCKFGEINNFLSYIESLK